MGIYDRLTKYKSLEDLNKDWADCQKCMLRIPEGIVCSAIATSEAKVLVVGKGPTIPESLSGRGMMTDPGGATIRTWFMKLARAWGLKETDIAFSNIVHCPSPIRDPNKPARRIDEDGNHIGNPITPTEACGKYLEEEIALIRPELIVSIGQSALNYFAKRNKKIPSSLDKARKTIWKYRGAKFAAIVMPIAASDDQKPLIAEDFHYLRKNVWDNQTKQIEDATTLTGLHKEIDKCFACELCSKSKVRVFGNGWSRSPLMIVGEGPGRTENETGAPFVGAAGKYLVSKILRNLQPAAGSELADRRGRFDLKRTFITNSVKGWTGPGNPTPTSDDIMACAPHLQRQIQMVNPKVIVCLGKVAVEAVVGVRKPLGSVRGQDLTCQFSDAKVIATWHPSFCMRQEQDKPEEAEKHRREMLVDFTKALDLVDNPKYQIQ